MFSKKKAPASNDDNKAPMAVDARGAGPSLKRSPRMAPPSLIGSDVVMNATLTSSGQVQIDGRVKGDVRCAILVIGEQAYIEGDILAEDVTIRGHVKGDVTAHKVHLSSKSRVEGDIHRHSMSIEHGAHFEGHSKHSDDPLGSKRAAADSRPPESIVKLAR